MTPKEKLLALKEQMATGPTPRVPRNIRTREPQSMGVHSGGVNPDLQPTLIKPKKGTL